MNVWRTREKTRGVRTAANYVAQFAEKPDNWPYKELRDMEVEVSLAPLLKAQRAFGGNFGQIARGLPIHTLEAQEYIALYKTIGRPFPTTADAVDRLIWP